MKSRRRVNSVVRPLARAISTKLPRLKKGSKSMSDLSSEGLKTIYEQVCEAHKAVEDFKAKLLALLPIASGAGIFLLLSDRITRDAKPHLVAIGIFGALVTVGLFLYDLRGIHRCDALIECGKELEEELQEGKSRGPFSSPQTPVLKKFVSLTWASLIIYSAVIGAWSYVAYIGRGFAPGGIKALLISGATVLVFIVGGYVVDKMQAKTVKRAGLQAGKQSSSQTAA
jgi:hypothetical protein